MKYEYQTVSSNLTTTQLNEWGEKGWDLVTVLYRPDNYDKIRHYFKRPIEETAPLLDGGTNCRTYTKD